MLHIFHLPQGNTSFEFSQYLMYFHESTYNVYTYIYIPLAAWILLLRTSAGLLLSLKACPVGFTLTGALFGAIVSLFTAIVQKFYQLFDINNGWLMISSICFNLSFTHSLGWYEVFQWMVRSEAFVLLLTDVTLWFVHMRQRDLELKTVGYYVAAIILNISKILGWIQILKNLCGHKHFDQS